MHSAVFPLTAEAALPKHIHEQRLDQLQVHLVSILPGLVH